MANEQTNVSTADDPSDLGSGPRLANIPNQQDSRNQSNVLLQAAGKDRYKECSDFVVAREGNYVNDPKDPGGETKYGISKRFNKDEDIKNLTRERAVEIYREKYWKQSGANRLSPPLDLVVFDNKVNPANKVSAEHNLRQAINTVNERHGNKTRVALSNDPVDSKVLAALDGMDQKEVSKEVVDRRREQYRAVRSARFEKGWLKRMDVLEAEVNKTSLSQGQAPAGNGQDSREGATASNSAEKPDTKAAQYEAKRAPEKVAQPSHSHSQPRA